MHETLKKVATEEDGPGRPAKLLTSTRVVSIDATKGVVKTADGTEHQGDVIVGADGVHSVARLCIPGWNGRKPYDSGKSAFRFMFPRALAAEDPVTAKFCEKPGLLVITYAEDRRLVFYPTNNNEELNFVCIHPSNESSASGDWNNDTSVEKMLEVYRKFDAPFRALISKANPATLKVWNLLDMEQLPTFIHEKLALIGDAAHPFLPHQGQGAGMAIEDAASLAVMLSGLSSKAEIPNRLKLYNEARYERAHNIQSFSRLVGQDEKDRLERPDIQKYTAYNFGHDEWDASNQRLRDWRQSQSSSPPRQPVAFEPVPGLRQYHSESPSTSVTATIKFKTSRTVLQTFLPPGQKSLAFKSPSTFAYASISTTSFTNVPWLAGGGYTSWKLWVHGMALTNADGSVVVGKYMPVMFEDLPESVLSAREESGMPKMFSDIELKNNQTEYSATARWRGVTWSTITLEGLKEVDPTEEASQNGAARGGPPSGPPSGPPGPPGPPRGPPPVGPPSPEEDSTLIIYLSTPSSSSFSVEKSSPSKPTKSYKTSTATLKIDGSLGWKKLPTLWHVVGRLAEMPVYEVLDGRLVEEAGR